MKGYSYEYQKPALNLNFILNKKKRKPTTKTAALTSVTPERADEGDTSLL